MIADYPFLETYLRGLLAAWEAAASARELLSLMQSLALFLRHYRCAGACLKCKGFLRAYIALLAASEQGVGDNLGEEEAAARQKRQDARAKLTPAEKKAKAMCNMKYKPKGKSMYKEGTLADRGEYTKALEFMEEGQFVRAVESFLLAIGTQSEPELSVG